MCPKKVLFIDLALRTAIPSLIPREGQMPKCFTCTSVYILYRYQSNMIFPNAIVQILLPKWEIKENAEWGPIKTKNMWYGKYNAKGNLLGKPVCR